MGQLQDVSPNIMESTNFTTSRLMLLLLFHPPIHPLTHPPTHPPTQPPSYPPTPPEPQTLNPTKPLNPKPQAQSTGESSRAPTWDSFAARIHSQLDSHAKHGQPRLQGIYGNFPKLEEPFWGFRVPKSKDYSNLRSILGSPYFGKLPYMYCIGLCRAI